MTKQTGVDMWPNAAIWMRYEPRSKVRQNANVHVVDRCDVTEWKHRPGEIGVRIGYSNEFTTSN